MRSSAAATLLASQRWLSLLCGGALVWLACVTASARWSDLSLLPAELVLGSFLVPVVAVVCLVDHGLSCELTAQRIAVTFLGGAATVMLVVSLLETDVYPSSLGNDFRIALTEELTKLCALGLAAVGLRHLRTRDGMVLGAALGFGYAAFETSAYALNSFMADRSLANMAWTEALRSLAAPVMHGLWTAILGAVLFSAVGRSAPRLSVALVPTYLFVSALHGLWDSMGIVSAVLTSTPQTVVELGSVDSPISGSTLPALTGETLQKVVVFEGVQLLVAVTLSLIGISALIVISGAWRKAGRGSSVAPQTV